MEAHYEGYVSVRWLPDGRRMQLLENFAFIDAAGERWDAPAGSIIDGASIPRIAWWVTGSPFVGKFRDASVVHDVYCVTKERPSKQVHAMFEEAMAVSGVPGWKRYLMAKAVKLGGPKF